ncbi:MAG: hypothetical protein U5K51_14490 [Flavobacteriaceae bacterium]|nr:hypothetical protein [Flavobacteriaceae bacterium]
MAFTLGDKTYYAQDTKTLKLFIKTLDNKNEFIKSIGFQDNDEIIELRGFKPQGPDAAKLVSILGYDQKEGAEYTAKVIRNGKPLDLKGKVKLNLVDGNLITFVDSSKLEAKNQWLYN